MNLLTLSWSKILSASPSDEYVEFEKLLDEAGINAWREQVDFLGRGDGMIEHIWCEYGIDKRRFSV